MRDRRKVHRPWGRGILAALALALPAAAQQSSVVGTLHNLSVSGPGEIKSPTETRVCRFCHIPHHADGPEPMWGHALSQAQYESAELTAGGGGRRPAPQPDGASRLCLSCHDGTIALGDVGGGRPVEMTVRRLRPGRRGFLGTDLSGSHPISFVYPQADPVDSGGSSDMRLLPLATVLRDAAVRLDQNGKMQCTTCHDAHADRFYRPGRVPRFWVKPTISEVCLTCHALR